MPLIAQIPAVSNQPGRRYEIYNIDASNALKVYPKPSGGNRIIPLASATPVTVAAGGSLVCTVLSGSTWVARETAAPS